MEILFNGANGKEGFSEFTQNSDMIWKRANEVQMAKIHLKSFPKLARARLLEYDSTKTKTHTQVYTSFVIVIMPLSQTLKKLKQVKGINQVLPNNWKRYSAPEELINSSTVLFVSYVMIILITAAIFAAQFVYYSNIKETVTEVTSDSSSNEFDSCEALQADAYYGLKLTKEKCMLDGIEEPSLTSVNFTGQLESS